MMQWLIPSYAYDDAGIVEVVSYIRSVRHWRRLRESTPMTRHRVMMSLLL